MEEKKSNGLAVASLVLGIVAIVFSFIGLGWLGLIIGIVGIVLGVMAKKKNHYPDAFRVLSKHEESTMDFSRRQCLLGLGGVAAGSALLSMVDQMMGEVLEKA